jgi:hypothetical protein
MGISFSRFGKFSAIILLNILRIPFACTSSPSSTPKTSTFRAADLKLELVSESLEGGGGEGRD